MRSILEQSGDYRVGVILEEEDARDALEKAKEFVMQVKKVSDKIIKEKF
jgi:uncharacterized protein (UPF0332 family)